MSNIIDLDALRPEPKKFKINGHVIDVSFIPLGITFDIDDIVRELAEVGTLSGKEAEKKAFDLTVRLCSVFCSHSYPEMTDDWFLENTSPQQIKPLAEAISKSLTNDYKIVEDYSKN